MYLEVATPIEVPQRAHADPDAELLERAADELEKHRYDPAHWVLPDEHGGRCGVCMVGAMMMAEGCGVVAASPYDMSDDFVAQLDRIAQRLGYADWAAEAGGFADPDEQHRLTDGGKQENAVRYLREQVARLEAEAR